MTDIAEKIEDPSVITPEVNVTHAGIDWTPEEEKRAVRKCTAIVMPLMILAFYSLQLDRGNISQALTGTLLKDVGITQDQLNNGQSILLVMIVIFEIPSNLILIRLGAKWWLSGQMIAWGVVATAQCVIRSPGGFYATRVLLGIAESGFIPGGVYYISTMFTHREQAKRIAWFYIGNICGKGSSGLIASGLLPKQGHTKYPGWALIFLVEGVVSIFIGLVCLVLLPTSHKNCRSLLGFRMFTEREAHILSTRVILDDPLKDHPKSHFSKRNIALALGSWRMWCHAVFCIAGIACVTAVGTYNPQVIKALGFNTGRANALSSVGAWGQAPLTLAWGYAMDHTRYKGPLVLMSTAIMLVLNGTWYAMATSAKVYNKWSSYAVLQLLFSFGEPFYTAGLAWAVSTARTPIQRSMYAAMYVMSSNSGQAIGGQMFRAADKPKYIKGFSAALGLYSFCFVIAAFLILQYVYSNKHNLGDAGKEAVGHVRGDEPGAEGREGEIEVRRTFQYPT